MSLDTIEKVKDFIKKYLEVEANMDQLKSEKKILIEEFKNIGVDMKMVNQAISIVKKDLDETELLETIQAIRPILTQ